MAAFSGVGFLWGRFFHETVNKNQPKLEKQTTVQRFSTIGAKMNDSSTKKQTPRTDSVGGSAKFLIWGREIPNFESPKWRLSVGSVFRGVGFFTKLSTKINQNSKNRRQFNDFSELGAKLYNCLMIVWRIPQTYLRPVACSLLLAAYSL